MPTEQEGLRIQIAQRLLGGCHHQMPHSGMVTRMVATPVVRKVVPLQQSPLDRQELETHIGQQSDVIMFVEFAVLGDLLVRLLCDQCLLNLNGVCVCGPDSGNDRARNVGCRSSSPPACLVGPVPSFQHTPELS